MKNLATLLVTFFCFLGLSSQNCKIKKTFQSELVGMQKEFIFTKNKIFIGDSIFGGNSPPDIEIRKGSFGENGPLTCDLITSYRFAENTPIPIGVDDVRILGIVNGKNTLFKNDGVYQDDGENVTLVASLNNSDPITAVEIVGDKAYIFRGGISRQVDEINFSSGEVSIGSQGEFVHYSVETKSPAYDPQSNSIYYIATLGGAGNESGNFIMRYWVDNDSISKVERVQVCGQLANLNDSVLVYASEANTWIGNEGNQVSDVVTLNKFTGETQNLLRIYGGIHLVETDVFEDKVRLALNSTNGIESFVELIPTSETFSFVENSAIIELNLSTTAVVDTNGGDSTNTNTDTTTTSVILLEIEGLEIRGNGSNNPEIFIPSGEYEVNLIDVSGKTLFSSGQKFWQGRSLKNQIPKGISYLQMINPKGQVFWTKICKN